MSEALRAASLLSVVASAPPGRPVDPANFIGDAWIETLSRLGGQSRLYANIVTFAPGARTNWHIHTIGQVLHVLSGVGRLQCRGQTVIELRPGQTANIAADVAHWHGAAPDAGFVHLAIAERDAAGETTHWLEAVTPGDYLASPVRD